MFEEKELQLTQMAGLITNLINYVHQRAKSVDQATLTNMLEELEDINLELLKRELICTLERQWSGPPDNMSLKIRVIDFNGTAHGTCIISAGHTVLDLAKVIAQGERLHLEDFILEKDSEVLHNSHRLGNYFKYYEEREVVLIPTVTAKWHLQPNARSTIQLRLPNNTLASLHPSTHLTVREAKCIVAPHLRLGPEDIIVMYEGKILPDSLNLWRHWIKVQDKFYTVSPIAKKESKVKQQAFTFQAGDFKLALPPET